jgi:cellulose synthase/poly-beta-1,6-N-acetylglucosamine synthase-like glycosyltransferase
MAAVLTLALLAGGGLALSWAIYPVVIHGLAALARKAGPAAPAPAPTVTVVVATREDSGVVAARIANLLASDYPAELLSVVVALDWASGLQPHEPSVHDSRVRIIVGDQPGGKAASLNAAVREATGDLLVFTDSHQQFAPDSISALVAALADARFGAVSGQLELPEGKRRSLLEHYWRFERRLRRDEAKLHSAVGVSGSIYAMRRALWRPLPAGLILDDLYVPMRLVLEGHRVGFTPAAKAYDSRRSQVETEFHRKVRTLTGNFQLCAWMPGVLLPWRNPVWLQFVLHKLFRLLTPWLAMLFLLAIAILGWSAWGPVVLLLAAGGALLVWLLALLLGMSGRLTAYLRWFGTMQAAIAVATVNGLTGRWNVWSRKS